ncbi:hypothetical protein CRYUN_Cryun05aG0028000 [Craigia yunnanensis]
MGQPPSSIDLNRKPQPGDHIYSPRSGGLFDHHGIYVGDDMVIHLQGPGKKIGPPPSCQKCEHKRDCNGEIIKTCLDCFLDHHPLHFYEYGVSNAEFRTSRRGTCSVLQSKPAHEVIKIATDFLEKKSSFGCYDVFANNCEDFAVYCKTGKALSLQVVGHIDRFALVPGAGLIVAAAYGIAKAITDAQRHR